MGGATRSEDSTERRARTGRRRESRREVESTYRFHVDDAAVIDIVRARSVSLGFSLRVSLHLYLAHSLPPFLPPSLAFLFPIRRVDRNRRASLEEAPRGRTRRGVDDNDVDDAQRPDREGTG